MRYFLLIIIFLLPVNVKAKVLELSNCIKGEYSFVLGNDKIERFNPYKDGYSSRVYDKVNVFYFNEKAREIEKSKLANYFYYTNEGDDTFLGARDLLSWYTDKEIAKLNYKKSQWIKKEVYTISPSQGRITYIRELNKNHINNFYRWWDMHLDLNKKKNTLEAFKKDHSYYYKIHSQPTIIKEYSIETYVGGVIFAYEKGYENRSDNYRYGIKIDLDKHTVTQGSMDDLKKGYRLTLVNVCKFGRSDSNKSTKTSSGTAFFINKQGNLITNHHVIDQCKQIKISYFEKDYETKVLHSDKNLDLAVLKAEVKPKDYISVSKNPPKKLQDIFAAGYPLGKGLSDDLKITSGIVSSIKGFKDNVNEIQIDAAINKGNSGGPIVSEEGYLIGISVAGLDKSKTESVNFGIKASSLEQFLNVNKIKYNKPIYEFSSSKDKLRNLLENSTVYISCKN